jgi:steroid delta-isomerase-like uncharacterized protein
MKGGHAVSWLVVGAMIVAASGCQRPPDVRDSREPNKALVRRWIEDGFNKHSPAVVDTLFAEQVSVNGNAVGREGIKTSMGRFFSAFPDLRVTIDEIIAEENKVGMWYTAEGTQQAEYEGIPATSRHVKWSGFDLLSIADGKIAEARFMSDYYALLTQLGASISPPRTP